MSAFDFNTADRQSSSGRGEPIPDGTVAPVLMTLRGIKASKTGAQGLDLEFTVTAGPFAKRKAWKWMGIDSTTQTESHQKMMAISRSAIRAMLESAYGVDPTDDSPTAMDARRISDWEDLDQLEFLARFSIEKGSEYRDASGNMVKGGDKNEVKAVTPNDPDYAGFKPARKKAATKASHSAPAAKSGSRPGWAS